MKNIFLNKFLFVLSLFVVQLMYSQADYNILNASKVSEIGVKSQERIKLDQDKPLPYEYVDERDILWSKIVWETIDLYQKQNFRLYFPTSDDDTTKNNRSLFRTLFENIKNGQISEVYDDSQFVTKLSPKEIDKKLTRIDTSAYGFDMLNQGKKNIADYIDKTEIKSLDIHAYQIKGMWYFNKKTGQMNYRLLAIAPMAPDVQTIGRNDVVDDALYPLFWVFYPNCRNVLHKAHPFRDGFANTSESFDFILNTRDFASVIVREENMYGNRAVNEYIRGNSLFQLREAERIKEGIRDLESDMWNY